MPTYRHPGVYLEEISSGVKPIEGVPTSIAAFVGPTVLGRFDEPVLISNLDEFTRTFGGIEDFVQSRNAMDATARTFEQDLGGLAMILAATAYYGNGGREAYFFRVIGGQGVEGCATAKLPAVGEAVVPAKPALSLRAKSPGVWANKLRYKVAALTGTSHRFTLSIGYGSDTQGLIEEEFPDLSMNPLDSRYAKSVLDEQSRLVSLVLDDTAASDLCLAGTLTGSMIKLEEFNLWLKQKDPELAEIKFVLKLMLNSKLLHLALSISGAVTSVDLRTDVATAIKNAVRLVGGEVFSKFDCTFENDAAKQRLVLSMPQSSAASVVVLGGADAQALGLAPHQATYQYGWQKLTPAATRATAIWSAESFSGGAAETSDSQALVQGYVNALAKLAKIRDVSIVVLPGRARIAEPPKSPSPTEAPAPLFSNDIIDAALSHCETIRNRLLIIDPPEDKELLQRSHVESLALTPSTYAALYYPWVQVSNPLYHAEKNASAPKLLSVEPSAFAAALWARTDARRGVWKSPAGVEASVLGISGLKYSVQDTEQDFLNPGGINCLRRLPGFGTVLWGARTLATDSDPEWRYISVRRTAILIEESIYNGIQWAVFEPNDHRLWSSLRVNIGSFMDGLFRAGAFQGEKSSDAYFVRCGLGDTMTQGDIDAGRVIAVVGFAPLKPAEFVIVRIQQKVQQ